MRVDRQTDVTDAGDFSVHRVICTSHSLSTDLVTAAFKLRHCKCITEVKNCDKMKEAMFRF